MVFTRKNEDFPPAFVGLLVEYIYNFYLKNRNLRSNQILSCGNLAIFQLAELNPAWCFSRVDPCRHKNNGPRHVSSRSLPIHCNRTSTKAWRGQRVFFIWRCESVELEMDGYLKETSKEETNEKKWDSFLEHFEAKIIIHFCCQTRVSCSQFDSDQRAKTSWLGWWMMQRHWLCKNTTSIISTWLRNLLWESMLWRPRSRCTKTILRKPPGVKQRCYTYTLLYKI